MLFAAEPLQRFLDLPLRLGGLQQRGAFVAAYGRVQFGRVPRPVLFERNEPILVLVRVRAAALTPLDVRIGGGAERLVFPYRLPATLGFDFAGDVVGVGHAVRNVAPGDAVFGRLDDRAIGALAEHVLVAAPLLAAKPRNVTYDEAATFPTLAATAHQALVDAAHVQRGESLFVSGGGSGLGAFALQYAAHVLGARVTVACAAEQVERCLQLGAERAIDLADEAALAAARGFDVALDCVGSELALWACKSGGRCVAAALGAKTGAALKRHAALAVPVYVRWLASVSASLTLAQAAARQVQYTAVLPRSSGDVLRAVAESIAENKIKPCIDRVYPVCLEEKKKRKEKKSSK